MRNQILATKTTLVGGINSLLVFVLFIGFVDNNKNIDYHETSSLITTTPPEMFS